MAIHATHMKTGLRSLASARTSLDIGFNERSLLSLVIPDYTGLRRETEGRTDELSLSRIESVWNLTVCHIIGAIEDLGCFA